MEFTPPIGTQSIDRLKISERTAYYVIAQAEEFGLVKKIGRREGSNIKYESQEITSLVDDVVSQKGLFRVHNN